MCVGNSALHYACAYGWYFCVKLLLEAGAQPDPSNDWKVSGFSLTATLHYSKALKVAVNSMRVTILTL